MRQEAFLSGIDDERIVAAIQAAESRSRGEIRVHVAEGSVPDARHAAEADFARLGMTTTSGEDQIWLMKARPACRFSTSIFPN